MLQRDVMIALEEWRISQYRKPLLIRGARQVGKSSVVNQFGGVFEHFITINFELEPRYNNCFKSLKPSDIVTAITLLQGQPIIAGKTLLFLDEIQNCPRAIQSLRYFKELMPELHVIAAGSLLEFALEHEKISMPVGRVEYLYMYPCSFQEYLRNTGQSALIDAMHTATLLNPLPEAVHQHVLEHFKKYMVIGGMPEALEAYIGSQDYELVRHIQNSILQTYRDDFGKYANVSQHKYLQSVYDRVPGSIGNQISYQKINSDYRSRDLKQAIRLLAQAGVLKPVYATSASGLPLSTTINEKKFKLQFLDVGLVQCKTGLSVSLLLDDGVHQLNQGGLAEQVVGQELIAYQDHFVASALYYWAREKRNAQAEIDFLLTINQHILPIEVKSGATGRLKSLQQFIQDRRAPFGIKISTSALSMDKNVLSVPLYMVFELPRLCHEMLNK